MGFQNSINQAIGTVGALAGIGKMVKGQQEQVKATNETNETLQTTNEKLQGMSETANKQWEELNKPDYGRSLTNAQAERKALASLMNAQFPGSLLKNYNPEQRIQNAQKLSEYNQLRESSDLAKEKELQAGIDYNYPGGKPMVRTLTEEGNENGK